MYLYREIYMSFIEILIIAVGLSMDAFAVSICKGLSAGKVKASHCATAGAYFGGFQALMPVLGWMLGKQFEELIKNVDHWIAFVLLALIGANMIRESFGEPDSQSASFSFRTMLPLAIATSIDALAVGVTFAFLNVDILPAAATIGVTTFALSAAGVKAGGIFGAKFKSKAELAGGIALVLMGIKILIQHLFFGG